MKKFFNYLKHNTHFFLLLYALIYIPWFTYLEKKVNINSNFHVIHVALDDHIPFCEFFVIPYYLWFVYMAIGILFIAFTDGKLCWRMGIFLITGMTVFLLSQRYIRTDSCSDRKVLQEIIFLYTSCRNCTQQTHQQICFQAFMYTIPLEFIFHSATVKRYKNINGLNMPRWF